MIRFFTKGLFYGMPLIFFGFWADLRIRRTPNNYSVKHNQFYSAPASTIDTLILGSSHSLKGINPEVFGSEAFNYAHVSQSFDIDLAILQSFPEEMSLETVILPVSLFSFFSTLGEGPEDFRLSHYNIYTDLDIVGSVLNRTGLREWTKYRPHVFSLDSSSITITNKGWEKMTPCFSEQELEKTSLTAFARHSQHPLKPNAKSLEAFNSIIQFCEKNEVKLILVTMPAFAKYRGLTIASKHWAVTQEIVSTLQREFPMITYINYFNISNNLETRDFHDADHLSELGAEKFSTDLAKRIKGEDD